jgi:hypothetical protein
MLSSGTSTGNLLVVWATWTPGNTVSVTTVFDSQPANSFPSAVGPTLQASASPQISAQIFYAKNITGHSINDTVTVQFSGTATSASCVAVEYSGVDQSYPLDSTSAGYSYSAGSLLDSGTVAPANANLLVFGAGTTDSSSTLFLTVGNTSFASIVANANVIAEQDITTSANNTLQRAPASGDPGHPGNWVMQMAVFRDASWTVTGGWNPARPAQIQFADLFPGTDACAKTKAAIETPVSGNNSPVVDSRGFISSGINCTSGPPTGPSDTGTLYLPPGALEENGFTWMVGSRNEIIGASIGYDVGQGTLIQAQTQGWGAAQGGVPASGSGCSASYSTTCFYWRGATATCNSLGSNCSPANAVYYALINNFNNPTNIVPGVTSGWQNYWTLASHFPSPVLEIYPDSVVTNGNDVESVGFYNQGWFCQYASSSSSQTDTDGCIGFLATDAQEQTRASGIKQRNPTVAGMWFDSPLVSDGGPYGPGTIGYDTSKQTTGSGAGNMAACKVNGPSGGVTTSTYSTQNTTVTSAQSFQTTSGGWTYISFTIPSVSFTIWVGEIIDIVSTNTTLSNIPALYTDENSVAHGFWMVWSVPDSTHVVVQAPSSLGTSFTCSSGCGGAVLNFFPMGLNVAYDGQTRVQGVDRGLWGWTVNGSTCSYFGSNMVSGSVNYSNFPPLAIQFSMGDTPLFGSHTEGHRVGACIGCFGNSTNEHITDFKPVTNTYTGLLIDNKFTVTTADIKDLDCHIEGPLHNHYCLIDLINGNLLGGPQGSNKNDYVKHYWLDQNGTAYYEGGDCSEMTKGYCLSNGVWIPAGNTFSSDGGCLETSLSGGPVSGKFKINRSSCTIVITMGNSLTAKNGWSCWANDETHAFSVGYRQTASTTTTASISMTGTTSDVIDFGCAPY